MVHAGKNGAECHAREDVCIVTLSWIELLTVHFYHVKWTSTCKHATTLQTPTTSCSHYMLNNLTPLLEGLTRHAKFGDSVVRGPDSDGRFGVAVTRWSRSTQLLYIEPG